MIASRRAWIRVAVATAAAASLGVTGGCGLSKPAPVKEMFVLEPASPPAAAKAQPGVLRIGTITVAAPYRGRGFVYRESELKYESDYYREFLVAPSAIVGEATARALAAANVFATVVPPGVPADPDWVLDGFVESLYGDAREVGKPFAVLSVTWFLRRGDGDAPFWSRRFERRVPFSSGSTAAYVAAQNSALSEILAELARDLSALPLKKP